MRYADAVFEGGGIKVIGLIGALSVAERQGYCFRRLAGTSAGAVLAALLAAGYKAAEIQELIMKKDFVTFFGAAWYDHIPYFGTRIGRFLRFCWRKGFYSGSMLEVWLDKLLAARGVRTFADLPAGVTLSIIASDITQGRMLILPVDLSDYGHCPAGMSVARAVRMSCSIPFLFDPVCLAHYPGGFLSYVVDGGVLSNFPVWIFDRNPPQWPTFGFRLVPSEEHERSGRVIRGPLSLLHSLILTMINAHDERYIRELEMLRTIEVPSLHVGVTDFHISHHRKEALYQSGVRAAEEFFRNWDFASYIAIRRRKEGRQMNTALQGQQKVTTRLREGKLSL